MHVQAVQMDAAAAGHEDAVALAALHVQMHTSQQGSASHLSWRYVSLAHCA
jgi:hypothetical protein